MHIALKDLSRRFGKTIALDRVSLELEPGLLVAVIGVNGAGKTTLLRCLASLVAPDNGEIRFDDQRFDRGQLELRRKLCFLPDFPPVFADMSPLQHIGMVAQVYQVRPDLDHVAQILQDFDMLALAEAPAGTLSRGQLYKTALAGLLAIDPPLWLLDEPFASGMDPLGLSAFKRYARDAASRGRTILYSTQILDVAGAFSDRMAVMHGGKLRAFGPLEALSGGSSSVGDLERVLHQLRESGA